MQRVVERPDYKFLIDTDSNKRVQLTAVDNFTAEMFQSEWKDLHHIKPATIEAALRKENPHIAYCLDRTQKTVTFTVSVNFQFLPQIKESIILALIEKVQILNKIQIARIVEQLASLQKQICLISHKRYSFAEIHQASMPYSHLISAGKSLIEFSGLLIVDYQYDSGMITQSVPISLQVFEGEVEGKMKKLEEVVFDMNAYSNDGYQYPFKFTHAVELKQSGKIKLQIRNSPNYITNAILTVTSL